MIWTKDYVKIFLVNTKTDKKRDGQWCTIMVSSKPYFAYQLLLRVMNYLQAYTISGDFKSAFGVDLIDAPVTFRVDNFGAGGTRPNLQKKWEYRQFLDRIKVWCHCIGLNPDAFSTHSLRRGGTSDMVLGGVPDSICMENGRWKSMKAYQGYIEDDVQLAKRAAHLMPLKR